MRSLKFDDADSASASTLPGPLVQSHGESCAAMDSSIAMRTLHTIIGKGQRGRQKMSLHAAISRQIWQILSCKCARERNHNPRWKVVVECLTAGVGAGETVLIRPLSPDGYRRRSPSRRRSPWVSRRRERRKGSDPWRPPFPERRTRPRPAWRGPQPHSAASGAPQGASAVPFRPGIDLEEVVGLPFLHDVIVLPDSEDLIFCRRLREGSALRYG